MSELPTTPVELNMVELGYLIADKLIRGRAKDGDPVATELYLKLKAGAIALGGEWRYGDPWDAPKPERQSP